MNTKAKKTVKIIADVFLWAFLVFALLMTILAFTAQSSSAGFPKLGDTCFLTVQSDSMAEPGGFYSGDLIIGKVIPENEKKNLKVGDVVTYLMDLTPNDGIDNKELNSHRIIRIDSGKYYTKGDHNEFPDEDPIIWSQVEAVWTGKRIPVAGSVINFLQSSTGFLVCIVIPLLLFFLYEIYVLVMTIIKIKNKDKKQISAADEELIKQRAIEEYLKSQGLQAAAAAQGAQGTQTPETPAAPPVAPVQTAEQAVTQQAENAAAELEKKTEFLKTEAVSKVEEVKTEASAKVEEVKTEATEKVEEVKTEATEKVEEVKTEATAKVEEAKAEATEKVEEVKAETVAAVAEATEKVEEVKTEATAKVEEVKAETVAAVAGATEKVEEVKTETAEKVEEVKAETAKAAETVEEVKAEAVETVAQAKAEVTDVADALKNAAEEIKETV